jgi:hypothetical protein
MNDDALALALALAAETRAILRGIALREEDHGPTPEEEIHLRGNERLLPATRLQEAEIRAESEMQAEASQAAAAATETETLKASILIRD